MHGPGPWDDVSDDVTWDIDQFQVLTSAVRLAQFTGVSPARIFVQSPRSLIQPEDTVVLALTCSPSILTSTGTQQLCSV